MPPTDPNRIDLVRRSVANSFQNLQKLFKEDRGLDASRPLRFESLEDRRVLSATGFEAAGDIGEPATALYSDSVLDDSADAHEIAHLIVAVNGEKIELKAGDEVLNLSAGDTLEVLEISYCTEEKTGLFAAEGYINKIGDLTSASLIDYNDGRFSDQHSNQQATGDDGAVGRLTGTWTVEAGWDRLTINLMHYAADSTEVAGRFFVNLEVGQPDFEFDTSVLDQVNDVTIHVGDEVSIPARWLNGLAGTFHNYAEVDIYHSSNMKEILWAGAVVGNADIANSVEGEFLNTRTDDPFSEKWTPTAEGEYVLLYYLDPEHVVAESNEGNNVHQIRVSVQSTAAPEAVNDHFNANQQSFDVLKNDLPANAHDDLTVAEFSQPKHGKISLNDDGTFHYTAENGYVGKDEFAYAVTDGDQISNKAIVSIDGGRLFEVAAHVTVDEDTSFRLDIKTEYDSVQVSGIPEGSEVRHGKAVTDGVYEFRSRHLAKASITPPANSDVDFQLTVTPVVDHAAHDNLSQTIDVQVNAVIDGGKLHVRDFGILAGTSGEFPVRSYFEDMDGSEKHVISLAGIPEFMELSVGRRVGTEWTLSANDLRKLEISSEQTKELSGWSSYFDTYVYKSFEVKFEIESFESASDDVKTRTGSFNIIAWQKTN